MTDNYVYRDYNMPDLVSTPAACPRCGKPYYPNNHSTDARICNCEIKERWKDYRSPFDIQCPLGWRCPSCQRVFAPDIKECNYCNA